MPFVPVTRKVLISKGFKGIPQTLGEHILKKRQEEGLTQKEVGEHIGVSAFSILNWEKGKTQPQVKDYPAITRFLGYEVLPPAKTVSEALRRIRLLRGWSRKASALHLNVDESTLRDWEAGKVILLEKHRHLVAEFIGMPFEELDALMRKEWVRVHTG